MKLLKVIFFLIPFWAFGQYQNSPNKAVLGNQTTGKGLIYYGSGAPAYTPINNKNAYHYVDTTTDVFWYWDFTSMLWDTVTVSGGGGGGTDSQVIDTFTYSSDTLKLSMSGDGQMYKYIVIPGSSDDQNIDTFSVVTDTIRLSLQSDGQKYKYINLLPYKDNTDTQTIYWNSGTGNLTIFGGNAISLDGRYLTTEADGSITNELQTIDTFSISSNTLRASLSSDGQAFKTVDLSPYLDNTDSQVIDTFSFSSDTLRISVSGDGQKYKTIYLPSVADTDDQNLSFGTKTGVTIPLNITDGAAVNFDEGTNIEITRDASNYITFKGTTTIDTATYLSDTLKLSLTNDGQAAKKIFIPQIEDTDDQTLLRSFDTIFISQGNYVILPVDINTDNQAFDTAQISSDTLRLSLEGDLVPVYKFNLKPYLDNTDSQVIDTFNYSLDTLRLSISGDAQKYKTIYLPNITDTDDQYVDTLDISSNNLRISLQGDNQALKTVSLSPYLDNTDSQTIDTMDIYGGVFLRTSLSGDGQAAKLVDLSNFYNLLTVQTKSGNILPLRSSTVTTDLSVTEGDNITLSKNGTYQFTIDARPTIDTFSYSSDTLRMSIYGDQQKYKTVYIPAGADDQTLSISAGKGTISISEGNSIQLADSTITNEGTLGVSAGAANTSVITSNTSGANGVTVQASGIISISESTSSNGGTITLTAVESDGSSTNELQTLSISGGKGSITLSAGGGTVTLNDSSSTNEIQTIDTFDLNSNNLRLSISSDGQALKTVSLASYLDNTDSQTIDTFSYSLDTIRLSITGDAQKYKTIYVPSISDTDDQSLSFGTKSGVTIPLNIQDGSGVNFDEGTNIEITRDASNYITFKGKTTLDTVSVVTDTARVSLTNDGQAYKTIPLSEYRQKVDTFSFSSDTIRISLTGDQERYKAIYLPNVTDTDDQYIDTFRVNSGNVELSLNGDGRAVSTVAVISIAPVQAVSAGTGISVSGTSTITVTNTGDLSTSNEIQTIDTFEINSNTLRASLSSDGQAFKTVSLAAYLDNTDSQVVDTFNYSSDTLRLSISGDGQKYKTIYLPNVADTDDQNLSFAAKAGSTNTLNISDGAGVNIVDGTGISISRDASNQITVNNTGDLSTTNEAWTIDGDDADTEVISNQTVKFEGGGIISTDYVPASDKIIITGTEVDGSTTNEIQTIDTLTHSSDTLRISLTNDGQRYKAVYVPTGADDQTIDTFQLSGNTLRLSLEADGQAYKTVDLSKYVDTTFAVNGTRISNDTLYWGSQSSSTDNGSALIHDTYIWQGGNDLTFFNNGDGPDKPVLYLSAVNDLWVGANSTSTAGTAGSADKPSIYFRYGNLGAYSFGVNTTSNLNALGNGATNFAKNGLASGNHSRNFQEDGIASSAHSINMGRSGEAKTDSYAWNSGAFGSAANFAAWNSGYDGDATNYYAFNTARVGLASGYSSVNMGESGVASGSDAKNFGNGGQASGTHAIGFSKFNVTSGNYGMNGSYYTESHAYGQSRWGYFGTDHNSQSSSGWVADNILFAIDNGKEDTVRSSALTASARGWFQLRDIGTTQTNITSAKQAPKAALEVVSTESGFIPPGGTLAQRNTIWNEGSQTGNFTATYTKGWQSISGSNIMDQNGLQFQVMNEYGGTSLYALRYNGSGYYWHQIY